MRYVCSIILVLSSALVKVSATAYDWVGNTSNSWEAVANWDPNTAVPGKLPGDGDTVTFTSGSTFKTPDLDISTDIAYLDSMTFTNTDIVGIGTNVNKSITFQNAPTLTVNGTSIGDILIDPPITLSDDLTIDQNDLGNALILAGNITGAFGLIFTGSGTTVLSGLNNYTGGTLLSSTIVEAGSITAFSSGSDFELVGSTLDLMGDSNTIQSLFGASGTVKSTGGTPVLTITNGSNGDSYAGALTDGTGTLGLTLSTGGTFSLSGASNDYSGDTTIDSGATLLAAVANAFSPDSDFIVNGTLDLGSSANTIQSLSGTTGTVEASIGAAVLTITNGGSYSGALTDGTGPLGLALSTGGTLTLGAASNDYTGTTTIASSTTLAAGIANAFSSASTFTVNGTLALANFNNTIYSLAGTGSVTLGSGTLTLNNGGSFAANSITGTGGITVAGGTLNLTGAGGYTGTTTITAATLTLGSGATLNSGSSLAVNAGGTFNMSGAANQSIVNLSSTTSGGVINLGAYNLTITPNTHNSFGGTFTGTDGSVTYVGTASTLTLGLAGSNYTGITTITSGTWQAGTLNAFNTQSDYVVSANGTLDLNGNNNKILSLTGAGTVESASGPGVLTITNGSNLGVFSGQLTDGGIGSLGIRLEGGMLTLTGTSNDYTGGTTVTGNTAILAAGGDDTLPTASTINLLAAGQLDVGTYTCSIGGLAGAAGTRVIIDALGILTVTGGGTYNGVIDGEGSLIVNGGTLSLGGNGNTFTGSTTITSGTLALTGDGRISTSSNVVVNGTLDIDLVATSTIINDLTGSGSIVLGSKTLIVNLSTDDTFSGTISGSTGGLALSGLGTLTLSGASAYSGATTIGTNTGLLAANTSALSDSSAFTVDAVGVLDLNGFANTIGSLFGAGIVQSEAEAAILTIANGGTFSGVLRNGSDNPNDGPLYLTLAGGTLTLTGTNTYTGVTDISAGTLALGTGGSIANSSSVIVDGTFDISNGNDSSINNLTSSDPGGTVSLGNNTLSVTLTANQSFYGTIIDDNNGGSLSLGSSSGSFTLTLEAADNSYTGTTTVGSNTTLTAGVTSAFAPGSDYVITGTLDLNGTDNEINSLSGAGTVESAGGSGTLTIANSGTFSGSLTDGTDGTLGINLTGGTLTLSGTSNDYTGSTSVAGATTVLSYGAAGSLSPGSAISLTNGGTLLNTASAANTVASLTSDNLSELNLGSGGTLTLTGGGTLAGEVTGSGNLTAGGSLTLSYANNSFTGALSSTSGVLALTGNGSIAGATSVSITGTSFNISGISSSSTTVKNLSGSAAIALGTKTLDITNSATNALSGNITGTTGGLFVSGSEALTLSGTNNYSGGTTVGNGVRLVAGDTDSFAPLSAFTVYGPNGAIDLNGQSNTINTLAGTGTVQSTAGAGTLTIANGGTFSGVLRNGDTGPLSLIISAGTLTLSGVNTYSGTTTIANGATISAGASGTLSSNSAMTVTGTLLLNNQANGVFSLGGTGSVNTGTSTSAGILTIASGGARTFSGGITGLGGITLTTGELILGTTISANTYTGSTTIGNGATLTAGADDAFAPGSAYALTGTGILNLDGYDNTIYSLTGTSSTSVYLGSALLTINGDVPSSITFAGNIQDAAAPEAVTTDPTDGLLITGGALVTLSGTNTYTGATTINDGTLTIAGDNALSPNTAVTIDAAGTLAIGTGTAEAHAVSVSNSGTLSTIAPLTLDETYTQTSGGVLTLTYKTDPRGQIFTTDDITLDGTLNVAYVSGDPDVVSVLLQTTSGVVDGVFSTFNPTGFGGDVNLAYALQSVSLYTSGCDSDWAHDGDENWNNGANWSGGCVPGVNGNDNDAANFITSFGANPLITVTLANAAGDTAQDVTLFGLVMSATTTSYTISKYLTSTITLDGTGGFPVITISGGSHTIGAPIILNLNSQLILSDGASLIFNSDTTLNSADAEAFTIGYSSGSGTGTLTNNGTLTPSSLLIIGATVQNEASIIPTNSLTIAAASGKTATVINSGTNAKMETSASEGGVSIGGQGTTSITNDGIGAHIGPTGVNSDMTVGSTGTTSITNSGINAIFGPTGAGGDFAISNAATTIVNTGLGVKLGATGSGGNVTVSAGSITNSTGALFRAGSGGVFTISGASITNDRTSTVGTTDADIVFTSGTLNTSGNVLAFDYTQSGSATLQLNLINAPTILGNVAASGTATVGGILTVNALPGSITVNQTVDLITAERGVLGTFGTVNYTNFPAGIIPQIVYLPNVVELVTSSTVTNNSIGLFSELVFNLVNEENILIQRDIHDLNIRIRKRNQIRGDENISVESEVSFVDELGAIAVEDENAEPKIVKVAGIAAMNRTSREQHYLAERKIEKAPNPSRFYFGPVDSFGTFNTKSTTQTGFGFNSVGIYTGFDHAFDSFGIGVVSEYLYTGADVASNGGDFRANQIQGSVYGTWLPPSLPDLSVNGIVGYGYEWIGMNRNAGTSGSVANPKSNIQGMEVDALLGCEYFFSHRQFESMPENVYVTPLFNLQYIWSRIGKFNEYNGGVYNLHVSQQGAQSLKTTLGTRFEYMFERSYFTCKSELDLGWQFEFLDYNRNVHFTTINWPQVQSISQGVVGAGCNTVWVGLDVLFTVYKVFELELSYDLQWNELYINNTFYLGIGGNF